MQQAIMFLRNNKKDFIIDITANKKNKRRRRGFFTDMSEFIGTKEPIQCKSHLQKKYKFYEKEIQKVMSLRTDKWNEKEKNIC